jgi:hypothetical protein
VWCILSFWEETEYAKNRIDSKINMSLECACCLHYTCRFVTYYVHSVFVTDIYYDARSLYWYTMMHGHYTDILWCTVNKTLNIPERWCVCPRTVPIFIKNAILIRNRLLRSLKPITCGTMQCSCKPLTLMCCHHWKSREANIFHVLNN